jgi:hypothetical protein
MLAEQVSWLLRRRYREQRQPDTDREAEDERMAQEHSRPDPVVVQHTVMNARPQRESRPGARYDPYGNYRDVLRAGGEDSAGLL